jgi:osmotically-inducible protein OsmY
MHEAASVRNEIAVGGAGGASVPDAQLQQKLAKALTYDRVGYGTTMFNAITVQVHNGVVELGGVVYGPMDKDSALSVVKNTAGVRGVIDHIQVAPTSPMDDRIRQEEARAIYGFPQLNRYAINPAKPIRIVVVNGHVTLVGAVDSQGDKEVAGIRANSVPGVFSVQNDLQVAGQVER